MNSFKAKIAAAWLAVLSFFGAYQYERAPTLDHNPPIVLASPTPSASPIVAMTPVPSPSAGQVPKMILGKVTGATDSEKIMIAKAFEDANKILSSDCFKQKVLKANFTETNGLSNQQIYDLLASKPITVGVEMFYGSWTQNYVYKTMGYDVGDGVAYMNRFYVKAALTASSLATHEAEGHGQGFHHYGVFSTSVPYQFNDFIESCAKEMGLSWNFISNGILHSALTSDELSLSENVLNFPALYPKLDLNGVVFFHESNDSNLVLFNVVLSAKKHDVPIVHRAA